ncbi:MAG: hypothetical protein K2K10_02835, partial [Acetatifactor sp.]|nr:hypothetical protein [Acetatifactor sp.]
LSRLQRQMCIRYSIECELPDSWMAELSENVDRGIPMFGARYMRLAGYDSSVFNEGNPMSFPDIFMVRALSKIEVINYDNSENRPTIDDILLTNRYQKGWLMQDWNFTGATSNVTATTKRNEAGYTNTAIPFHREGDKFTIYIPEMDFGSISRDAIRVNLDMYGVEHYKMIYLAPYGSDGKPIVQTFPADSDWYAIKRNYIYQYDINSLAFEFIIDVNPWVFGWKNHIQLEQPDEEE